MNHATINVTQEVLKMVFQDSHEPKEKELGEQLRQMKIADGDGNRESKNKIEESIDRKAQDLWNDRT